MTKFAFSSPAVNLIIDLGNTLGKFALYHQGRKLREASAERAGLEEIRAFCGQDPVSACILSSVIDPEPALLAWLESTFRFIRLDHTTPLPIRNLYASPQTLGNDRLACAVAAAAKFPGRPVLSVDAGTCIKYDLVNAQGEYLGGAISPGLEMRLKAMHTFTARLPLVELSQTAKLTGNTTRDSLLSGALNGAVAEVRDTIRQYRKDWPGLRVLLTGGDRSYFEEPLKNRIFAVPDLLFRGLNLILEHNA